MKKTLLIIATFSLFFVTNYILAQTVPTVPPRTPDPISGCTGFETTTSCRPEWAESLVDCIPGSLGVAGPNTCIPPDLTLREAFPVVQVCSQTNSTGACRPERVNPYAAGTIARQAQNMGEQLGYTISCEASITPIRLGVDPTTNLNYFMNSLCTVNGQSGFSAELLVSNPSNWEVLATELKSIEASKVCGIYKVVYWNKDGSYKCIASPSYTDTCVGAENYNKFNYVTGKSCNATTTTTPPSPTHTTPSTTGWATSALDLLSKLTINLKSQLDTIGKTGGTQTSTSAINLQSTASYVSSVSSIINNMSSNLKNQLNSIGTGQKVNQTIIPFTTAPIPASASTPILPSPVVNLTVGAGQKSGTYSVGETINYQITMQNVDSVNSYYTATPGDTCVGGSNNGEQKDWVVKTVAPSTTLSAVAAQCQAGNTYIISVVGTNKTSGKTVASSISVYIKNSIGSVPSTPSILSQYYSSLTPSISEKEAFNFNPNKNSGWFYIAQTIPENGVSFWVAAMRSISTTASDPSAQLLYGITNTNTGEYYPGFISNGIFSESPDKTDLYYEFNSKKILEFRQIGTNLGAFELKLDLPWGTNSYQKTKTLTSSKPVIYESGDGVIPMDNGIDSLYASIITDQGYWIDSQKFNIASVLEALSKLKANHRWMSFVLNKSVGILPAGTAGVTWEILDANDARRPGGFTNVDLLIPGSKQLTALNALTDMKIDSIETWKGVEKTYLKKWKLILPGGMELVFETLVPNQENNVLGNYFYEGAVKVLNPSTGEVVGTGMFEATHSE